MKIHTTSKALTQALETLRPIYSSRTTLPAISNVLIQAAGDKLTISANDLDTYCQVKVEADVIEQGEIAVIGQRLLNAVKNSAAEEVTLEIKDKSLHFQSGKSKMRLSGLSVGEIPTPHTCEATSSCELKASELIKALSETIPFVTNEPTRYILQGVHFEGGKDHLDLVATNGLMLSARKLEVSCEADATIPTDGCKLLCGLIGTVKLSFSDNAFCGETDEAKIVGKLIEGKYPQWRNVIPARKEQKVSVTMECAQLLSALPFIGFDEIGGRSPVHFLIEKDQVILSAKTEEQEGTSEISAKVKGTGFKTCFPAQQLRSVIMAHGEPEITFQFIDHMSPLLVERGEDKTVVVAMRVQ